MCLFFAPALFITSAVHTIVGLGVGIGIICTNGKHQPTIDVTFNHLCSSNLLFTLPYAIFLDTINPEAKIFEPNKEAVFSRFLINFINPLNEFAESCYNSDNFLKKHVASRLTCVLLAVSCLVNRAADGVIGIGAGCLSIVTVGKYKPLNNLAFKTLQAPGIINDLFYCTIKFINPLNGIKALDFRF
jgi:hypothetical protein